MRPYDTRCFLRIDEKPKKLYLAPTGEELPYEYIDGVSYTVNRFSCHAMVVAEFDG